MLVIVNLDVEVDEKEPQHRYTIALRYNMRLNSQKAYFLCELKLYYNLLKLLGKEIIDLCNSLGCLLWKSNEKNLKKKSDKTKSEDITSYNNIAKNP